MKNNTKAVIKFLQANKGLDFTAQDVAQALSLDVRVVNGIFTALQRDHKVFGQLGMRVPATIDVDGTSKDVKYLVLTPAGLALDVDAIEAK